MTAGVAPAATIGPEFLIRKPVLQNSSSDDRGPDRGYERGAVRQSGRRRTSALAVVIVVQALCAVFFVADVLADFHWVGLDMHTGFEAAVALALVLGVVFGALEMRRTLERTRRAEAALSLASGAFAELVEAYFERWGLTPSEAEVALLALKGFEVAEIAKLRGAAAGTVRAQLTRVYAKSGLSNRTQLVCLFIEDLLDRPVAQNEQGEGIQAAGKKLG